MLQCRLIAGAATANDARFVLVKLWSVDRGVGRHRHCCAGCVEIHDLGRVAQKVRQRSGIDFFGEVVQCSVSDGLDVYPEAAYALHECLFGDVVPGAGAGEQPWGAVVHRVMVAAGGEVLVEEGE